MQLPHPRAAERAFVLQPWYDVEPDAEIPDVGLVAELLEKSDRSGLTRRDDIALQVQ
jgi:2-amino-4-hydroxy-6-hydroxymethyldihydropteridine diphosphokinase